MNSTSNQFSPNVAAAKDPECRRLSVIAAKKDPLVESLLAELRRLKADWHCFRGDEERASEDGKISYLCVPPLTPDDGMTLNLNEVKHLFQAAAIQQGSHVVLLSSALVYGTGPGRPGLVQEVYSLSRNSSSSISSEWNSLEAFARDRLNGRATLTILRPAIILAWNRFFSRLLEHKLIPSLPGHDPNLQFLSLSDLAAAIVCAVSAGGGGTYNVAPDRVIPLHQAIRLSGKVRFAIPRTLQRMARTSEQLEFVRYSWSISNARIKKELGFRCRKSSATALHEYSSPNKPLSKSESTYDEFGMDKDYIRFYGMSLFRFLSEHYWRIENRGLEYIPSKGRAILVGMHRGFMPWDGVMALHTIVKSAGRYPRFLTHPALLKFPFLANFMIKLGGIVACQESAAHVLENDELLGIFPEGIHGAFTPYRKAYQLQGFGRDVFVKLALRHRAPIIPFVTVGSAEIFPIFGKIKSRLWTRYAGWPSIPITPTFPLLPAPLPSKWHTQFLPPVQVDQYPPEAAEDRTIVKAISREVKTQMQQAIDEMLARRRSIFFGSIFKSEPNLSPALE